MDWLDEYICLFLSSFQWMRIIIQNIKFQEYSLNKYHK